jgi:nitrous oxide reductase
MWVGAARGGWVRKQNKIVKRLKSLFRQTKSLFCEGKFAVPVPQDAC